MDFLSRVAIFIVAILAAVLLFTPSEAYLEGLLALAIVMATVAGFLMHPRREVFYVTSAVRQIGVDRSEVIEKDLIAVRVELTRLWLLFVPTFLAVAFLVLFAAAGPTKFSFLNWLLSSRYEYPVVLVIHYPPLLVLLLLSEWIVERRVMRDAEACSARSFRVHPANAGWIGRVAYLFMGERGEYYGGHCMYFRLVPTRELASIVFYKARTPEVNRIAMGFLFHRLIVLGRGVTELDEETVAAQAVLAETSS